MKKTLGILLVAGLLAYAPVGAYAEDAGIVAEEEYSEIVDEAAFDADGFAIEGEEVVTDEAAEEIADDEGDLDISDEEVIDE